ncbi:MAG: EAL domain-containing protein [Blautia sp.]|nr:EAL domain-containing protein [Blautia sp.]
MKRIAYLSVILIVIGGVMLVGLSPDTLSMVITGLMWGISCVSIVVGIVPLISFSGAFQTGVESVFRASEAQTDSVWIAVQQIDSFFRQRILDSLFEDYKYKVNRQRESGQIMSDVEAYINEDTLALRNWNSIMIQIPGTLTGLGILGTFIGLAIGIGGVGFSSIEAALSSVQVLLSGIEVAFYTSIVGVIFSIVFNITYRMIWNMTLREMGMFQEEFHKHILPPAEEQQRYRERRELQQIIERLDRIPKNAGFSLSNGGEGQALGVSAGNEQILMPQILQGLKEGEFIFYLQPQYDLNTRRIIGAEALVRWNHGKLGLVSPAVFIPVLEKNGYITKLDQYIWEQVCKTIRRWIDTGVRPVPISVNVSKTDILALDVVQFFTEMVKKYRIPPRNLDIEIAKNAYIQTHGALLEVENHLQQSGFRIIMDGFDGDFFSLNNGDDTNADVWKLDLRFFLKKNQNADALYGAFDQARKLHLSLIAEGIENMEQVSVLKKCGCTEGQGYYFTRPVPLNEFEDLLNGEMDAKKER